MLYSPKLSYPRNMTKIHEECDTYCVHYCRWGLNWGMCMIECVHISIVIEWWHSVHQSTKFVDSYILSCFTFYDN